MLHLHSRLSLLFCAVTFVAGISGCASLLEILGFGFTQPEVSVREIEVRGVSAGAINIDVRLFVKNPNDFELKLARMEYSVKTGEISLAHGMYNQPFTVVKQGTNEIKLPVTLDPGGAMTLISKFLEKPKDPIMAVVEALIVFDTPIGQIEKQFIEHKPIQKISL